jgi:ethanolamine utilization protein EutA
MPNRVCSSIDTMDRAVIRLARRVPKCNLSKGIDMRLRGSRSPENKDIMANPPARTEEKSHGLADHQFGEALPHRHASQADHDHDDFEGDTPLQENPLWIQDHVTLTSVGVDIGSSGTQVIFSKIHLRRLSEELTSRYYVVSRETLFLSPVSLTPYQSETRIDAAALQHIVAAAYRSAGLEATDVDTGAVILTGEALRRENAQAISGMLAAAGGDFVCATAGHHMESMLAAYGSGASRVSLENGARILNIDIGGGTTKLALIEGGRVIATAAVHIGGRLQVVDAEGCILRLDPAGRAHARRAGFDWKLGDCVDDADLDRTADVMAGTLMAALSDNMPSDVAHLYLTDPLPSLDNITGIMASGGVAEYIYGREARDFGDMGRRLGRAIRRKLDAGLLPWPLLPAGECIRATALGASEYSVQLSGNTSYISDPGTLLPRRNLQVLQPAFAFADAVDGDALARAIRAHRKAFEAEAADCEIALAFHWQGPPAYERIHGFAHGIAAGLADKIAAGLPIYIMLDGDIAQTLGAILREDCKVLSDILCIDGVMLMDFDYIDLGRVRVPSYTVPVTIKSLVFSDDPKRTRERIHHHDHHHDGEHGHHHHDGHHHHHHE